MRAKDDGRSGGGFSEITMVRAFRYSTFLRSMVSYRYTEKQKMRIRAWKRTVSATGVLRSVKKAGMTQTDLAPKMGVSVETVSRWEKDEETQGEPVLDKIESVLTSDHSEPMLGEPLAVFGPDHFENPLALLDPEDIREWERQLEDSLPHFLACSRLPVAIAVAGALCGMIANFAFQRGIIGGILGIFFHSCCHLSVDILGSSRTEA